MSVFIIPAGEVPVMEIQTDILTTFPGLFVSEGDIGSLTIEMDTSRLKDRADEIIRWVQERYTLDGIRDEPLFRAYRDFFWSVGVDPTKTRPASEALVRRVLAGKPLPTINTAVDAYNLASIRTGIPLEAFDADCLNGDLMMRFAVDGEEFLGIGMKNPVILKSNQVVLVDNDDIVAIYPYRDSDATKITRSTETIHLVACGVPKVEPNQVREAYDLAEQLLEEYAG